MEAVAAVNAREVLREPQTVDDLSADANRLVGQDGHAHARLVQRLKRLGNARIGARVIELMVPVVLHEKLERLGDVGIAGLGAHGAANQNRGAVPDVVANGLEVQRRQTEVCARRVDRMRQVELRIDQRAVQVEDEQVHCRELCHSPLSYTRGAGFSRMRPRGAGWPCAMRSAPSRAVNNCRGRRLRPWCHSVKVL